jgi:predicted nucleic acid-binding protein
MQPSFVVSISSSPKKLRTELIIDEREASTTAQMFEVRPVGTIAVLLFAFARGELTLNEFKGCLGG